MNTRINFKGQAMQNDDVFVSNEIINFSETANMPTRKGMDNLVVSNGKIVNVVSEQYGHLPNEKFFLVVEEKLIEADVQYMTRSINRDDRSFAVDYILNDDRYIIDVANGKDIIKPMLRFVNSYDGSCKTSGNFGYFRQVCTNGLHVAETKMSFSVKHKGSICEFVLPEIQMLVNEFMSNEYYNLKPKIQDMSNVVISDVQKFVEKICKETALFRYDKSDNNPEPSKKASVVIDTILSEANYLGVQPNMWLGYNAFNEFLHNEMAKSFEVQKNTDGKLFETIYAMAN